MMRVYLSGPMTGLPEYNYPRFFEVAEVIRDAGHWVYNPAEYDFTGELVDFPVKEAFAEYCRIICTECDAIVLLENWQASTGVAAETSLARAIGVPVIDWIDGMDLTPPL